MARGRVSVAIFENFDFFRVGEEQETEIEGGEREITGGKVGTEEDEKVGERDIGGISGEAEKEKRLFFFFL